MIIIWNVKDTLLFLISIIWRVYFFDPFPLSAAEVLHICKCSPHFNPTGYSFFLHVQYITIFNVNSICSRFFSYFRIFFIWWLELSTDCPFMFWFLEKSWFTKPTNYFIDICHIETSWTIIGWIIFWWDVFPLLFIWISLYCLDPVSYKDHKTLHFISDVAQDDPALCPICLLIVFYIMFLFY